MVCTVEEAPKKPVKFFVGIHIQAVILSWVKCPGSGFIQAAC